MPSASRILFVTLAIQALTALALVAVPVVAPTAAAAFGMPATYVGIFVGLVYVGGMWSTLLTGGLVHRYGAIRVSQVSLLLCAAGLLALTSGLAWLLLPCALLIGCGYGPITPASSHLLMKTTPRHLMALVFSIKQTGVPIGGMLAGLLVPPAMILWGWRGAMVAVALACVVVAFMSNAIRRALDTDLQPHYALSLHNVAAPVKMVWSTPVLRLLGISSFSFAVVQLSTTTFLIPYLIHDLKMSLVAAGMVFSVTQGAGVVGRVLWGYASDRYLSAPLVLGALGLMMGGASMLIPLFDPDSASWLVIAVFLVYGAAGIGWNGVFLAEVARQAPEGMVGVATGGSMAITFFGSVLGPPVFGLLVEWTGSYPLAFIVASLPATLCGVAMFRARRSFALVRA